MKIDNFLNDLIFFLEWKGLQVKYWALFYSKLSWAIFSLVAKCLQKPCNKKWRF